MEQKTHSLLGGSSAERWTKCPGSVAMPSGEPTADKASAYYGTLVHALFERAVKGEPLPRLGEFVPVPDWFDMPATPFDWEAPPRPEGRGLDVTREVVDTLAAALACVTMWRERFAGRIDEEHVEHRVQVSDAAFGTADFVLWADGYTELVVLDLKTGRKQVSPEHNPQLLFYATGCLQTLEGRWDGGAKVHLHIVQPALQDDCTAAYWTTTASAVSMWANAVLRPAIERAAEAMKAPSPTPWLSPGSHCRYCPASGGCPMLLAYLAAVVGEPADVDPTAMSDESLAELLFKLYGLKDSFYNARTEAVRRMLEQDRDVPGWQLRRTGSPAKWADGAEEELALTFGEAAYERALLSPAEVARRFGKTGKLFVEEWAAKSPGGYTVVPSNRRRTSAAKAATADAIRRARQITIDELDAIG